MTERVIITGNKRSSAPDVYHSEWDCPGVAVAEEPVEKPKETLHGDVRECLRCAGDCDYSQPERRSLACDIRRGEVEVGVEVGDD